ncbi:MAG TPA: type II toxin-antitoxin system HicA family toxin [Burkholderiaceae bacterium]|nr:type II toxin-antitoxin system HicA family toxin [Burkholderiaceae bacterium]
MPKLPHVSGAEVQRALERLGFQKVRQSGSHVVMKRDSKGCVVPMHSEVKIGTLAGLLRQAEVSSEEFLLALRKS